jgi:TolA-binding protein
MSAAPVPKPTADPGDSPEAEGWALLDALRRKIEDQAAQQRKTVAQVTQLAESIAALVEHQRQRSRWLNINSFVAYLVFTILLGGAFYFVYQSRARDLVGERDRAVADRDAAVRRADEASTKLAVHATAPNPAPVPAPAPVAARPEPPKPDVIKDAVAAFKAGRSGEAIAPLEAALATEPPGARAAEMHYLLGVALLKRAQAEQAVAHLQTAVADDVPDDDARFQLASALDRSGQPAKARVEYDKFATAHPQSPFAVYAMRRSAAIARGSEPVPAPASMPAGSAAPAPAGSAAEPPAAAPAP